jgi:hypothetical protein
LTIVSRKVQRLVSGAPVGALTPTSGRMAKDEAGRVFRFVSLEQAEASRKAAQRERDKRNFSFGHMRHIHEITRELSNKYCGYILLLQPHIQFKTNKLVIEGRNGFPLKLADLAQVWNVSKRTAKVVVDELQALSIIFDTNGVYAINERYHFRGKASGDVDALIKTYFTTLKTFNMSAADLGFVYKLLSHVHLDTNLICADPFASPEDIRFLTDGEISECVGLTETKTKEALARLRKSRIISEWYNADDRRVKFTALNPYVFYRKQGEPDGMLKALFSKQWI